MRNENLTAKQFLTKYSSINKTNGCIEWTRFLESSGYGNVHSTKWGKQYKIYGAHQLAYIVHYGTYNRGLSVLHKCNNRKCINTKHLYLGTQKQNMIDKSNSGIMSGINNCNSKFSFKDVSNIKELLEKLTGKEVAKIYNVHPSTISKIKLSKSYKD